MSKRKERRPRIVTCGNWRFFPFIDEHELLISAKEVFFRAEPFSCATIDDAKRLQAEIPKVPAELNGCYVLFAKASQINEETGTLQVLTLAVFNAEWHEHWRDIDDPFWGLNGRCAIRMA